MVTTLDICLKHLGWQSGTLQDVREHFAKLDQKGMDSLCGKLVDAIYNIADPAEAVYFTAKRLEAVTLHRRAVLHFGA